MTITVDYSPEVLELIAEQAKAESTSVEEFVRASSAKAARNAAYLAKLDRAKQSMEEGRGTVLTDGQLRSLIYGNDV